MGTKSSSVPVQASLTSALTQLRHTCEPWSRQERVRGLGSGDPAGERALSTRQKLEHHLPRGSRAASATRMSASAALLTLPDGVECA